MCWLIRDFQLLFSRLFLWHQECTLQVIYTKGKLITVVLLTGHMIKMSSFYLFVSRDRVSL